MEIKNVMKEVKESINKIEDEKILEDILISTHGLVWSEAVEQHRREGETEKETIVRAIIYGIFEKHAGYDYSKPLQT